MLNSSDKSVQKINAEYNKFNPDNESAFFNKKDLGDGIVVYQVENSKEGQAAVRKAIDSDWGYDKNPWCLAARKEGSLDSAWRLWEHYNKIPKRIAFKNGKLHAFSATSTPHMCQWWDRNDKSSKSIPNTTVSDDLEFLKQFCPLTYIKNNPNSPLAPDAWKKLSEDKDYKVREQVARNPKCPLDILKKLSEDNTFVRMYVARNSKCPLDILKKLSEDKDKYVRADVARNPKCPLDILKKLSEHDNQTVKEGVAKNPKCPPDILKKILKKLSEDKESSVRACVARNSKCPLDILKKLSEDKDKYVRLHVAENPNCPLDILEKLANPETEKYERVRSQAKKTLQSLKNLKNKKQNTR